MKALPVPNDKPQYPLGWTCDEQSGVMTQQKKRLAECSSPSALGKRYEPNACPFALARSVHPPKVPWTTTLEYRIEWMRFAHTLTITASPTTSSQASSTVLSKRGRYVDPAHSITPEPVAAMITVTMDRGSKE